MIRLLFAAVLFMFPYNASAFTKSIAGGAAAGIVAGSIINGGAQGGAGVMISYDPRSSIMVGIFYRHENLVRVNYLSKKYTIHSAATSILRMKHPVLVNVKIVLIGKEKYYLLTYKELEDTKKEM